MDSTVSRYWCVGGMNSRNMAESTGRFPPTPTLHTATREQRVTAFGDAPAAIAKTPVMNSVRLNAHLKKQRGLSSALSTSPREAHRRPHISEDMPQNAHPAREPRAWPNLSHAPW